MASYPFYTYGMVRIHPPPPLMCRLEYDWNEKGMVRVKGIFEEQIRSSNE